MRNVPNPIRCSGVVLAGCALCILGMVGIGLQAQDATTSKCELNLRLESAKSSYLEGEPMKFWLIIQNEGQAAKNIELTTTLCSKTTFLEESNNGADFRRSVLESPSAQLRRTFSSEPFFFGVLLPGREKAWPEIFTWKKESMEPGLAYFRVRLLEKNSQQVLYSDPITIDLKCRSDVEEKACHLFEQADVSKFDLGLDDRARTRDALKETLSQFPNATFSTYARYYLGRMDAREAFAARASGDMSAQAKTQSAVAYFLDALDDPQAVDFSFRDDALAILSRLYHEVLDDTESARFYAAQLLLQCPISSHRGYAMLVVGKNTDAKSALEILKKFKKETGDKADEESKRLAEKLLECLKREEAK